MKNKGLLYIIIASVLWGTSGIFVHFLSPYGVSSLQMTFIRGFIAFLCMSTYIIFNKTNLIKTNFKELLLFMGSGISFFMTATCYFYSMQLTSISTAVVLMYTAPIFVMLYSVTFLGEKLTCIKLFSVVVIIAGCGLVSGIMGGIEFDFLGIAIGFLSGIAYASYNIITKIEMKNGINPLKANFYCFLFSIIIGVLVAEPVGIIGCIAINPPVVISLAVGVGIFACILPYLFYTMALQRIPAGTASSLAILEPMAATLFSVIIFGEKLSLYSFVGIVLILGSVFLLSRQGE